MIPSKTPYLAAIAWLAVATAYAWVSNRDYDDAVLAHQTAAPVATVATVGRNKPALSEGEGAQAFPADAPESPETAHALFRPTNQGAHP